MSTGEQTVMTYPRTWLAALLLCAATGDAWGQLRVEPGVVSATIGQHRLAFALNGSFGVTNGKDLLAQGGLTMHTWWGNWQPLWRRPYECLQFPATGTECRFVGSHRNSQFRETVRPVDGGVQLAYEIDRPTPGKCDQLGLAVQFPCHAFSGTVARLSPPARLVDLLEKSTARKWRPIAQARAKEVAIGSDTTSQIVFRVERPHRIATFDRRPEGQDVFEVVIHANGWRPTGDKGSGPVRLSVTVAAD